MPAKTARNFISPIGPGPTLWRLIAQSSPSASVTCVAYTRRVFQKQTSSEDEPGPPLSSPGRRTIFTE